jgi:hypothetical protein
LIERIFHNLGHGGLEAHIRARVTYYHQAGYCALAVHESRLTQRRLSAIMYTLALSGRKL